MSGCVNIALRDILAGSVAGGYGASHAKQAAQLSRGLLCLLCACGAGTRFNLVYSAAGAARRVSFC